MARKISRSSGRSRSASSQKSAAAAIPARRPEEELVENMFLGILLFFLAVLVFTSVFSAGFIWDDDQLLTANPQVHSAAGWWTLWFKPETADYFPLTSTTLWIEYHLGQFCNLWNVEYLQRNANNGVWNGYHIMNVLFHATTVVLTWQTLKRLRIPGAWVAAAIFAVHPVCVESVAWISERKNTISQIFFLLSIINYVRFEEKGRTSRYVWAIVCFTLALLAKTSVVMLPFILLLLAWWRVKELEALRSNYDLEKNERERWILLIGVPLGAAIVGILGYYVAAPILGKLGAIGGLFAAIPQVPAAVGMGIIFAVIGWLVASFLRRTKLANSFFGFETIWTIPFFNVALLLGAVTVYFQYGRAIGGEEIPIGNLWQRMVSACFATGFYLYSALWPFNIIEIYPQWHRAFSLLVTEPKPHWDPAAPEAIPYYIQVIPGVVIAGLLFFCWTRRTQTWARALLVGLGSYILAMLPALGLLTMSYMRLTLVADHFQYISIISVIALVVAAGNTRAMKPLWLGAAALFFAIVSYLNWERTADNRLWELLWIAGPIALAISAVAQEYWKFVWRGFVGAMLIGFCIISWGQADIYHSEETLWTATLEKNPTTWQGHNHLGAALYMRGDVKDAAPHFLRATQLKPENPESHNNLGLAYSMFGDMPDAINQYQIAVGIKDDSAMDTNLANAYEQVKRYDDAIAEYKHALTLNSGNASAHCNLGYALMQQQKIDEAIPEFMKTIEMDPGMPQGRADLLQALRMKGVNLDSPDLSAHYSFDLAKAIELLKNGPMPQQPMPQ